jgi:N-acetylglucosaminyl-diphospho-decaprenol L-rhamnosyltransferase
VRTSVITTVRGRHEHLRQQLRGLARCTDRPDEHVVVTMNDAVPARIVAENGCRATVIACDTDCSALPVAAARNMGADIALDLGAELLIFLDVDCIPAVAMIDGYRRAAADRMHRDALLCGPVTYLPPPPATGYDLAMLPALVDPHPARPTPEDEQVLVSTDYGLFWSLSFAVTAPTWRRIGGFCTCYRGYGGEDTDFAQLAAIAGVGLRWVGGAHAFHQFHAVSDPPVEHLVDIVANARTFYQRWGWWPMRGWLQKFAEQGLISWGETDLHVV